MSETLERPDHSNLKSQAAMFSWFDVNSEADIQHPRDGQSRPVPSRLFRLLLFTLLTTSGSTDRAHAASSMLPDNCHANELTRFIGKPVSSLQEMELPESRFICDRDCVATADIRPSRLTVTYSRKTNRILRLKCE